MYERKLGSRSHVCVRCGYEAICNIRAGQRDFGKKDGVEYDWDNHPQMAIAVEWCQENGMAF